VKPQFHGLNGLRGIAAFAVLFLHGSQLLQLDYIPPAAGLAVDFFFLLSGFVLAYAYDARLHNIGMTWWRFMALRSIRLYPMLFIGTVLGGIVLLLGHDFEALTFLLMTLGSLLLLPVGLATENPFDQCFPFNNPVWSLFFEFAVNGLYGSRFGKLGQKGLAGFVLFSGVGLIVATAVWDGPYSDIGFQNTTSFLLGSARVCYPFWAGILIFRLGQLRRLPSVPISCVGVLLLALLLLPFGDKIYSLTLVLLVFPVLLAGAAAANCSHATIGLCAALGELSYPLYLVHQPIFRAIKHVSAMLALNVSPWMVFAVGAGLSVLVAEALLFGFDQPIRKLLMRLLIRGVVRSDQESSPAAIGNPGIRIHSHQSPQGLTP
jgi:peptidoglycan/LPS O-acetylase OafA/YrhL